MKVTGALISVCFCLGMGEYSANTGMSFNRYNAHKYVCVCKLK